MPRIPFPIAAVAAASLMAAQVAGGSGPFDKKLSKDKQVIQALDRLTFGARPGDLQRVKKMGLKKWIEEQLHPERIPDSPLLEKKLAPLDSLRLSTEEIARQYPPPQLVKAVADGRIPPPKDPELRALVERLAERYKGRKESPKGKPQADLREVLSPGQIRTLRTGAPGERIELLRSLEPAKLSDLLFMMPPGIRRAMFVYTPADLRRQMLMAVSPQQVVVNDLVEGKLYRAIYTNRQLEEVLTDFWFNHFNVYLNKGPDRYLITSYERDAIRPYVLGKFGDMLRATAGHPAMLYYLDNWQSVDPMAAERLRRRRKNARVRGLNENYARELMELHTLGVDGGYTQQDIIEVARCFTGWSIRDPRRGGGFQFNQVFHDKDEKTVLGVKIPAGGGKEDGLKVLDILLHHPSTAHFISSKLAQRFVADNPPEPLVMRMAETFRKTDGDLREVMRTMLKSREFFSEGAFRAKVKSPLEMVVSAARALDADVSFAFALGNQIEQLGQPLYRKEEPTGYSNNSQSWVNTASLLGRMNFALALAENKLPGVKVDTTRLSSELNAAARQLLLVEPSRQTRAAIAEGVKNKNATPALVAGLALGSPEFQRK